MKLSTREQHDEEREQRKKRITEKQTQGFRECDEIGVGPGEGGDLRDRGEIFGDGGGKDTARDFKGNGKRGF